MMLMSYHYLLHVADSIKNCGPCWTWWQYPMEHMCGMLLPLVRSRLHPYVNLANNIMLKAPIGSGYNRKPNRTEAKFGSVPVRFREPKISVRFGSDPKN